MRLNFSLRVLMAASALLSAAAFAQPCPDKNVQYWQAFPPGGESDLSARHQQMVLKKKCAAIETVVQYKAGAGGALMWTQMNTLPADGVNVVGINLPHIVFQPIEGQVQYKTADVTPVYWFHYTPDILVVPVASPIKTFAEFLAAVKKEPGKFSLAGEGLNVGRDGGEAVTDDFPGDSPWAFTGGTIKRVFVDVSGDPFVDLAKEAQAMFLRD